MPKIKHPKDKDNHEQLSNLAAGAFKDVWGWKKLYPFHKTYSFLEALSLEKCMSLVYLSPAHTEKSLLSNKQLFMSESAPLLSNSEPYCWALSLLKKTERAISADSPESFSKAFS